MRPSTAPPSGTPTLAELMRSLPGRLHPGATRGWEATFHFLFSHSGQPEWTVRLDGESCTVTEGLSGRPDCVVETSESTFLGIAAGTINPQTAFLLRRVKVSHPGPMLKLLKALRARGGEREVVAGPPASPVAPPASAPAGALPLAGVVVLDCTRMLPGAVLARHLLELGARVIKVEEPGGDPLRHAPPLVDGVGAGFATFYRGAQSVELDLRTPAGADALRRLARAADVLVESFRPGTLARWGVDLAALRAAHPPLITCSLSGYGGEDDRPAHDLNATAASGLLSLLGEGLPKVLLADVAAGMLAATGILGALVARAKSGLGAHVEQPLVAALRPFLAQPAADLAAGGEGLIATHLSGACPAYRRYRCGDGRELAVAAVEPKFWQAWVELLGLPHLAGVGLDPGEAGARAAAEVEAALRTAPREHWLERAADLPVSPVLTLAEAVAMGGVPATVAFLASGGGAPAGPAPAVGEHTAIVLTELGVNIQS